MFTLRSAASPAFVSEFMTSDSGGKQNKENTLQLGIPTWELGTVPEFSKQHQINTAAHGISSKQ